MVRGGFRGSLHDRTGCIRCCGSGSDFPKSLYPDPDLACFSKSSLSGSGFEIVPFENNCILFYFSGQIVERSPKSWSAKILGCTESTVEVYAQRLDDEKSEMVFCTSHCYAATEKLLT
jgi:hypothetical protein